VKVEEKSEVKPEI